MGKVLTNNLIASIVFATTKINKSQCPNIYLGYSKYDFWTSGNRLGTGMFLWMSTGLPFNATFDHFENTKDAIQAGLLDPIDHNSNTSPQRTARDRYYFHIKYIYRNCNQLTQYNKTTKHFLELILQ